MKVLVINSGSSSIKYQLFVMPQATVICTGLVERIGLKNAVLTYKYLRGNTFEEYQFTGDIPNHTEGLKAVANLLTDVNKGVITSPSEIDVVGHRVVHGGANFVSTALITQAVKDKIRYLFALSPLHNPAHLLGINVAEEVFASAKQVAVFDTAFHQTMPPIAYRMAVPKALYEKDKIRNYGFHGTSHKYVSEQVTKHYNNPNLKIISLHLGNGCSITAIANGKCRDTSMGLGPMNGLVMGTRVGDIDQTVIFYMVNELGYTLQQVNDILNKKSGLLGLAGVSDMRDLQALIQKGDADAILAHQIFVYKAKKFIGSYIAALNGVDVLLFTGGIGENDAYTRAKICENLEGLNIYLDAAKNSIRTSSIREIQADNATIKIVVVPTNEEKEIATQCYTLCQ
ncbi:acetate/propionate family kinase [Parasediminibacterium paludis]|uniref:Acetate kinase n=1 Tax=Parasediminibacterium paludis TaxID=908966 RepID=A0ABV8Q1C4_9BACT